MLLFSNATIMVKIFNISAFKNGNPEKLLVPHDTDGRFCGIDESVIDRPFLFYFDITKCLNPALNILKSGCPTTQVI